MNTDIPIQHILALEARTSKGLPTDMHICIGRLETYIRVYLRKHLHAYVATYTDRLKRRGAHTCKRTMCARKHTFFEVYIHVTWGNATTTEAERYGETRE